LITVCFSLIFQLKIATNGMLTLLLCFVHLLDFELDPLWDGRMGDLLHAISHNSSLPALCVFPNIMLFCVNCDDLIL